MQRIAIMIKKLAVAAFLLVAPPALAAGPEDPVRSIMDVATALWSDNGAADGQDYFDATHLKTLYTKAFVAAYREAAKYPLYEEAGGPFGYDVVANSQEGCPLKDIVITNMGEKAGVTDIKVTFKLYTCYTDDPAYKDKTSEVHFDVVTEDGKPLISDFHRIDDDGKSDSLMKEMQDIAKNAGDEPPTDQNPIDSPPLDDNQAVEPAQK